jgi:phage FluMu gp28-like protein
MVEALTDADVKSLSDRELKREMNRYFLDYQREEILDESRLSLWEKSIRIGATYCHAMRAVRRRQTGRHGDLLHTSVNERIAKEFVLDCARFCRIYDVVGSSDVLESEVFNPSENRTETAFEIRFRLPDGNSVAIKVFSSNPDCLRGAGGEVNIDELTSHKRAEEMLKAAGGRAMWGFAIRIWTSHKGVSSCFNRMLREERAKGAASRWKIRTTTLVDALDAGLLEKINEVRKLSLTREEFLADTIAAVGGQEAFEEECLCKPRSGTDQAVPWHRLDAARLSPYPFKRVHVEGDQSFDAIAALADAILDCRQATRCAIGYDVARTGHLSAIPLLAQFGKAWRVAALITTHKRKFSLQRAIVEGIMRACPRMVGAGDKTGLGMQICEELTEALGNTRFVGINFGQQKGALGTKLTQVFEDGRCAIPAEREHDDIAFDIAALQKASLPSGRAYFEETANPVNKLSHCDIAWAIALALFVGDEEKTNVGIAIR